MTTDTSQPDENKLRLATPHQLALKNRTCVYCCEAFSEERRRTREHVIGRNFGPTVPEINLIAWACHECNNFKSDLEDDISLISLIPPIGEGLKLDDPRIAAIQRKANSAISRRTRKSVKDSRETIKFTGQIFPGVTFSAEMVSNPQADHRRVQLLAMFHVQAFFYFITYNKETQTGSLVPGAFEAAGSYREADWGNERARAFMTSTQTWDPRLSMCGDDAFFQVIIRRKHGLPLWSWAVEWNKTFRILGFFGDDALVREALAALPMLKMKDVGTRGAHVYRMRDEVALPKEDDTLFVVNEEIVGN